ncbi:MbnP family protein [Winogradskyella ursingii]|uniref:MbnP family protein n=1 Tax=Winogradskyella ursingii TaxID=2686079 RepID=UPI0015C7FA50|nr:MbnP family protein [Winogradskyella ursingii]
MKNIAIFVSIVCLFLTSCSNDNDDSIRDVITTFQFSHNWNGETVTNEDFNDFKFINENGETLSIERLRYIISDMTFTTMSGEDIELDIYNLVDVTNGTGLFFSPDTTIPSGTYSNVSFTFGLDNEDNSENYQDLNSASFNVPAMLGGGYHYMQFDGKYLDADSNQQSFNYHSIRAVDNPGDNPNFPQDTFFTVNLGETTFTNDTTIEIEANLAEWFKSPNLWNLNELNTVLMPNSAAQIMMYQNGQTVFNLKSSIQ